MSQFLESICAVNGKILNLNYHQERVDRTFNEFFGSSNFLNLENLLKNYNIPTSKTKIRIIYSNNERNITFQEYQERKFEKIKIVIDNDINYGFKSSNRDRINEHVADNKDFDDIIFVKNDLITDSSYANLLFFDGTKWYTPKEPLLKGTKREELLEKKIVFEKDIALNELSSYCYFMTVNALLDFDKSRRNDIDKIIL